MLSMLSHHVKSGNFSGIRYYSEKLFKGRCDGKGALSPRTVRHHHVTLHDALESAVKLGLLTRNVADAVNPPRYQRPQQTLNEIDISNLLEAAKKTPYYVLFYQALFTGMRRSELLALRWCDVDLVLCQAYVTRTLHHLRTGENVIGHLSRPEVVAWCPCLHLRLFYFRNTGISKRHRGLH